MEVAGHVTIEPRAAQKAADRFLTLTQRPL